MSETQVLLNKIATLRKQLEEVQGLARDAEPAAMADTALRMVQAFPDGPRAQPRLCDGLGAILGVVAERVAGLTAAVAQRRRETAQVDQLAGLLTGLHAGELVDIQSAVDLA